MTPDMRETSEPKSVGAALDKRLADEARFIRSWIENPLLAGAVSPSSRFLARAMAHAIDPRTEGPIVELGPGTGPVTQALIDKGVAPARLVLVEYDENFCRLLAGRFPGARIVQGDAYNLPVTLRDRLDAPASAIVSSLPLLNKPEMLRLRLLADALELMEADGVFVQFTYGMVSPMPLSRRRGARHRWFQAQASAPILRNLPPARVWAYRRPGAPGRVSFGAAPPLLGKLKETTGKVKAELKESADKAQAELADFKDRFARLQEEWREVSGRAEARLKVGADRIEAELKEAADKAQAGLIAGARKLLVEIEETTRKLRDGLDDKARRKAGRDEAGGEG